MEVTDFEAEVRFAFGPVAARLGLQGPVNTSLSTTELRLRYRSDQLGVELAFELIGFFVFMLLCREAEDATLEGYEDVRGRRQKVHLQDALRELNVDVDRDTKALRILAGDYRNAASMIDILAQALETNWRTILTNRERLVG